MNGRDDFSSSFLLFYTQSAAWFNNFRGFYIHAGSVFVFNVVARDAYDILVVLKFPTCVPG
jgi:hypothetical protein